MGKQKRRESFPVYVQGEVRGGLRDNALEGRRNGVCFVLRKRFVAAACDSVQDFV
jgi:hypothetical protein